MQTQFQLQSCHLLDVCAAVSEFVAEVAGPHEISSLLHTTGGSNVVNVVNDVPDWLTTPELVTTEPSESSGPRGGVL